MVLVVGMCTLSGVGDMACLGGLEVWGSEISMWGVSGVGGEGSMASLGGLAV